MHKTISGAVLILAFIIGAGHFLHAEEKKVKGVEVVTDTVAAVVTKANALLSGNLEITMSEDREKYKNRDQYTMNALGERVPRSTIIKK